MILWILLAVMTALAALAVLVPLSRAAQAEAASGHDVSVYRDQIAEIERDLERGLIDPREAEAARTEIARRLLKAARVADEETGRASGGRLRARLAAAVAILVVPAVALGLYLSYGKPELPDQPLQARLDAEPERQTVEDLVTRVEAHLLKNPEDGRGWDVIAPVYLRLQRPGEAASAYRNAIRLMGSDARRQFGLGQALTLVAGGVVTAEARAAFEASAAAEPTMVGARMYLALALSQEGRDREAVEAWRALVAAGKGDEPWLATARNELAAAEKAAGLPPTPAPAPPAPAPSASAAATIPAAGTPSAAAPAPGPAPSAAAPGPSAAAPGPSAAAPGPSAAAPGPSAAAPGPSAADMAAAAALPPEERARMIDGMVARLAERLKAEGGTVDEWARLIRSLSMLGRTEDARAAALEAREKLKDNAADRGRIEELSKGLGLAL